MNVNDIKQKADDIKDQTAEKFEEARENIEDMATETRRDIDRKGGEVKGHIDQWQDDRQQSDDTAHSSELDSNPLDPDTDPAP